MASVHIRNRNNHLYLEIYENGVQKRKTLGLTITGIKKQDKEVLKAAEIIRSKAEIELACNEWGIFGFEKSCKLLISYMEENYEKSRNGALKRCIFYIKRYKFGNIKLSAITPDWISDFQEWLLTETSLSQGSANLYSAVLRTQLHLAVRDKLISKSPADFVKNIPVPESKKEPLTNSQIKTLSNIPIGGNLGSEVKSAFLFSCCTGLRISDLKSLKWNMINKKDDGSFWLKKFQNKTGKSVCIPLNETALKILDFQAGFDNLKKNTDGKIICLDDFVFSLLARTKTNTDQYLNEWGKKVGIEHLSWHTARHTMATLALEKGAEIRTVCELLGHTNISTTMRYANATDALKVKAVESLPTFDLY